MAFNTNDHETLEKEAAGHVYSVSELTHLIKGKLETEFGRVWVEGELSSFTRAQSGHVYFSLKDEYSQIKAVMFRSRVRGLRFELENGLMVVARGQVTVYAPRGEYQIVVETLEPKGLGALQLAFEQLKAKLAGEGIFDESHKKPIPYLPENVGVVTSPTGAAVRDIIQVMKRRFAGVGIILRPVRVQGEGAAGEIAAGIRDLNEYGKVDVIIIGRGGGSLEDLWAFNEEEVARAVYDSKIPVISAVGHEIDFTISDFAADLRAPTPSAAAELVVKNRISLVKELGSLEVRLKRNVKDLVSRLRLTVDNLSGRRVLTRPEYFIMAPRQRFDEAWQGLERVAISQIREKKYLSERLAGMLGRFDPRERLAGFRRERASLSRRLVLGISNRMESKQKKLVSSAGRLQALSPLAVLGRGYGICRTVPEGKVISDAGTVSPGDEVNVLLRRGALDCRVTGVELDTVIEGKR